MSPHRPPQNIRTASSAIAVSLLLSLIPAGSAIAGSGSPLVRAAQRLGLVCSEVTSADGISYDRCTGEIASFDGVGIDTDLSIPLGASHPLPALLMLHGWGGDKTAFEADSIHGSNADTDQWNNVWFVSRGWAVLNTTARGFGESCGMQDRDANCASGWTHLADRAWEIRDWRTLLGTLVDAGIADRKRLASTGLSYGGGQSWELATALPWRSAGGSTLQLAAAVPRYPWTDLLASLVPNGRQSDSKDQGRSHSRPFGVMKQSYVSALYALGRSSGGRYDTVDQDYGANLDLDYALITSGEPYAAKPGIHEAIAAFRDKSAFDASAYLDALRAKRIRPVPVMSIQGWTDPLFPATETLQMFRELKRADPAYPITMAFADIGHPNAQNPAPQWRALNALANRFLDRRVRGIGRAPSAQAYAFVTSCPPAHGEAQPFAGRWDGLAGRSIVLGSDQAQTTTSGADTEADGAATDPIANAGCMTEPDVALPPGVAGWDWKVPGHGLTMLGLPRVRLRYVLTGTDATLAFKLWDVSAGGTKTLVTRGVYRLSTAEGDGSSGRLTVELFGNCWRFPAGDRIQLEVAQSDAPYLRPDDLPSTIDLSGLSLTIPARSG